MPIINPKSCIVHLKVWTSIEFGRIDHLREACVTPTDALTTLI